MGAIELQVFVGLVVILGAAFVALICDFLKGNNEQLRESNIELKVRHDERDKRDQLVQDVQRQTIEVVAQIQRVTGQRVAMPSAAKAEAAKAEAVRAEPAQATTAPVVKDARTLFEEADQARQGRGRRDRRRMAETAVAERPSVAVEPQSPAAWAQEVYLRRFPQAESRRGEAGTVAMPEQPAVARPQPVEEIQAVPAAPAAIVELAPVMLAPVMAAPVVAMPEAIQLGESVAAEPAVPVAPAWELQPPEEVVAEAPVEPDPVAEPEPAMSGVVEMPLAVVSYQGRVHGAAEPVVVNFTVKLPAARFVTAEAIPGQCGGLALVQAPMPGVMALALAPLQALAGEWAALLPNSGLETVAPEIPVAEVVEPEVVESELAETDLVIEPAVPASNVVRIRVLREEEVVVETAVAELASQPEVPVEVAEAVEVHATAEVPEVAVEPATAEPEPVSETEAPVEVVEVEEAAPVAEVEVSDPESEPELVIAETVAAAEDLPVFEPSDWRWEDEPQAAEPAWLDTPVEPVADEPVAEPVAEQVPASRSNVVEMPAAMAARTQDAAPKSEPELVVPGGYHEPHALARLMEEPGQFRGLAMVVSLVDYVRLLADQGKPAMEQLMGSVSRQVVSMTREQDFACRIGEDEFVLLFVKEGGAAAKRRIQMVAERLWDFQLRSLGSMSVLFSWGAAESAGEPLAQVVERAREQMIETRRSRRALGSGAGRFRRVAND